MRITKNQLKRLIKEEANKLAKHGFAPAPMKSRADPEFARAIKKANLKEVEYYGGAGDLQPAIKEVMSILQGMRPEDRNPEIYMLIDDLEDLASRG